MKKKIIYSTLTALILVSLQLSAQVTTDSARAENGRLPSRTSPVANQPRPYKDVVTAKAITTQGFIKVHRVDARFLFEIPFSILERDILSVGRVSQGSAKTMPVTFRNTLLNGDQTSENIIAFRKGPRNKIFMIQKMNIEKSTDSTGGMAKAIANNNLQPLVASFDIKAYTADSSAGVIDLTDFLNGDNNIFFFENFAKRQAGITSIDADKSFIETIKTFPINIEIATVKTYKKGENENSTYGLNTSLVLLPEKPMKPRYADRRVGYFGTQYIDYDVKQSGTELTQIISRWRLEPRPGDMEKYKRGELVEPQKPIVIYIDPATPEKWVPYLIAGVNDWQVAFEKAGFKNAIMAKRVSVNDSSWSLENSLYSAIVYKPSSTANARGPHVADPRSGEIIETHIDWYHNVMDLLYKWYFVQCANVDSQARKPRFDDELMGKLIRFVSSHEVGHTLGLMHNFGSSATVPVENLRNKAWVEANGHTPSIMDYARFNYVAQPGDNIGEKGLFPRIGAYDKWAIEWGYRLYPDMNDKEAEIAMLEKRVTDSLKANKYLIYGQQGVSDPRNQSEVLGDNPMQANNYGIKNLKAILPHIQDWTADPGKGYDNAKEMYKTAYDQYIRYIGHVIGFITGRNYNFDYNGRPIVTFIPKAKQKEALAFMNEHFFTTPKWLVTDPNIFGYYGYYPRIFSQQQESVISNALMSNAVLEGFLTQELYEPGSAYTLDEYLDDLSNYIMNDALSGKSITEAERRNLQRLYVDGLCNKIKPGATAVIFFGPLALTVPMNADVDSDIISIMKVRLQALSEKLKPVIAASKDEATKNHLVDLNDRIQQALNAAKTKSKYSSKK